MTTAATREKLHHYINIAVDKKIEARNTMDEDEITENTGLWVDEEFFNELYRRTEELESGEVRGITLDELKTKF